MIPYASRTGTRRNLRALSAAGWRLLVSARGVLRHEGFPYALDNGAWTAHQKGEAFDVGAFEKAVAWGGHGADFLIVPDIVCGGLDSLAFSMSWIPRLSGVCPLLLAVQDGIEPDNVRDIVGPELGIAVGGSTEWKEQTIPKWGKLASETGAYLHVLRVNTCRRIDICRDSGVDSFDGSSVTRFVVNLPRLDGARRQLSLFGGKNADRP